MTLRDALTSTARIGSVELGPVRSQLERRLGRNKLRIARGNIWSPDRAFVSKTSVYISGTGNLARIGESSRLLSCSIRIAGNNNRILIGNGAVLKDTELWIEDDGNVISIGANTSITGRTHIACIEGTSVTIGPDCLFSRDIRIATGDSHAIIDAHGERINPSRSIEIAEHVWIGAGVTCLKGVSIQSNSIIGSSTLLSKPYHDEGVVIAGNPGRVVRRNVNWTKERSV